MHARGVDGKGDVNRSLIKRAHGGLQSSQIFSASRNKALPDKSFSPELDGLDAAVEGLLQNPKQISSAVFGPICDEIKIEIIGVATCADQFSPYSIQRAGGGGVEFFGNSSGEKSLAAGFDSSGAWLRPSGSDPWRRRSPYS